MIPVDISYGKCIARSRVYSAVDRCGMPRKIGEILSGCNIFISNTINRNDIKTNEHSACH